MVRFRYLCGLILLCIGSVIAVWFYIGGHDDRDHPDEPLTTLGGNVIFLETSGRGTLTLRQLASVESAANHIYDRTVTVWIFTDGPHLFTPPMKKLQKQYQVKFIHTTIEDFVKRSNIEPWYKKGDWRNSPYKISHTSDALRFFTIWKFGGMYLDLDVIIIRPWQVYSNFVLWENMEHLSSAIFSFKKSHSFMLLCIEDLVRNYDGQSFAANGPHLISRVYQKYIADHGQVNDIAPLGIETFNGITLDRAQELFEDEHKDKVMVDLRRSVGVHLWNKYSRDMKITKGCAFLQLLKDHCPIIYEEVLRDGIEDN